MCSVISDVCYMLSRPASSAARAPATSHADSKGTKSKMRRSQAWGSLLFGRLQARQLRARLVQAALQPF